jgi:hypothetical protein
LLGASDRLDKDLLGKVVRAGKELVQPEGEEGSDGALFAAVVFRLAGYRQKVLQSGPCRGFIDPSISGKTFGGDLQCAGGGPDELGFGL